MHKRSDHHELRLQQDSAERKKRYIQHELEHGTPLFASEVDDE